MESKILHICEWCLKYFQLPETLYAHSCKLKGPPGKDVYKTPYMRINEIDGKIDKNYCQNLCLLSKLFLDHKTVFYDTEPFLFYVLTKTDSNGANHLMGYFSKVFKLFLLIHLSLYQSFLFKGKG